MKSFLFTVILATGISYTQAQKSFLGIAPLSDTVEVKKEGFFFLPLLYYTPDTRLAVGAAGVYYFHAKPKYDWQKEARSSYFQFLTDYTQNKQLDVWGVWDIFTRNEDYLLEGELRFRNFPDRFYGVGNNTMESDEEFYEYNLVSIKSKMMRNIVSDLFVGIDYQFEYEYGFKYSPDGTLGTGTVNGDKGGFGSAVGLVAAFDSRDNIINAYNGRYTEVATYLFHPVFGSTFNYFKINSVYQQYWELKKNHILTTQTKLEFNFGNVPFLDMAKLGDDDLLRGYAKNRYRDHNFWATQVEYRFPLFWRFGMVAFAGVGDVYRNLSDLQFDRLKYSVGTGLRFVVKPAERLNIRIDYGLGRDGGHYYFLVSEAF